MTVFKCKMCGGTIEFNPGDSVGVCDSCGTRQTLPRLDDERRANLYDRANHFRRNNEFDKASSLYEQVLNEDPTDAEAYWSLVLCRYGIEYVEDPATHKRVPTVNRTQFTSIFDDEDYKSALKHADGYQRTIYEEEATAINEIQKGILEISQKENPFDVFICYKETDAAGRRTQDSVLANDLYHQLTQEGFKVFFSRITLEDKIGTAYEPYIFAALNSARVMVVLGTKAEYFNAVWVKNEWSRYLSLVKQSGGKKVLIPAYRDMDPYDLPEEFSHLQAQDMSKLGFMQDLIRGIKKITGSDKPKAEVKETVVSSTNNTNVVPLLKRAFMFLEDKNWKEADEYCEKVLDQDPENAKAYLGKLMAEFRCHSLEDFANLKKPFDSSNNYQKVVRFGDVKLTSSLKKCIDYINERNENDRLISIYDDAVNAMNEAYTEEQFKAAAEKFNSISGFKDADTLARQCLEKAEESRKDVIYANARKEQIEGSIAGCESAIKLFESISGWKDADEQSDACRQKIKEIKAKEETDRLERERWEEQKRIAAENAKKKRKKIASIITAVALAGLAFAIALIFVIIPTVKYNRALALIDSGDYESAFFLLEGLNYKDSASKLEAIKPQYHKQILPKAQVGSYVFFGSYDQDNRTSNGKEEIEWLVLAKEGNRLLIISRYGLDCQQYDISKTSATWETCSLRNWLNDTFLCTAFSEEERAMIPTINVIAETNSAFGTKAGNSTTDKVFLLSITEANSYFNLYEDRKCPATPYAASQGAFTSDSGNCQWWLRSPGDSLSTAACVYAGGSVSSSGCLVSEKSVVVRPALWIDLENKTF